MHWHANPWAHTDSRLNDLPPLVSTQAHAPLCSETHAVSYTRARAHTHTHTHTGTPPSFTASSPVSLLFLPEAPPGPLPPHPSCLPACPGCPHILHTFSSRCSIAGGSAAAVAAGRWMGRVGVQRAQGGRAGEDGALGSSSPPVGQERSSQARGAGGRLCPGSVAPQPSRTC